MHVRSWNFTSQSLMPVKHIILEIRVFLCHVIGKGPFWTAAYANVHSLNKDEKYRFESTCITQSIIQIINWTIKIQACHHILFLFLNNMQSIRVSICHFRERGTVGINYATISFFIGDDLDNKAARVSWFRTSSISCYWRLVYALCYAPARIRRSFENMLLSLTGVEKVKQL